MIEIDECGKWEITDGDGCKNRILIEPAPGYDPGLAHPQQLTLEELQAQIAELQEQVLILLGV